MGERRSRPFARTKVSHFAASLARRATIRHRAHPRPLVRLQKSSLSTRRFSIAERINGLFEIDIAARSPIRDLDLEALIARRCAPARRRRHGLPSLDGDRQRHRAGRGQADGLATTASSRKNDHAAQKRAHLPASVAARHRHLALASGGSSPLEATHELEGIGRSITTRPSTTSLAHLEEPASATASARKEEEEKTRSSSGPIRWRAAKQNTTVHLNEHAPAGLDLASMSVAR
jgi:hypothetical protein